LLTLPDVSSATVMEEARNDCIDNRKESAMISFCTRGLLVLLSVSWAAGPAHAQNGYAAPSLLPLPNVAPVGATKASYNSHLSTIDSYGSAFISPKPDPAPAANSAPILAPGGKETGRTAFDESMHATG